MNILLINLPNIPFSEQKLLIQPIDVITLGTYLQELKHNVKFLDMDCKKLNCNDLTKYIENEFMPDIIIVSYDYHIPLHTQKALENIAEILEFYESDMTKYADNSLSNKIILAFESIPVQLAKDNQKFQYKVISKF